jgi:predicted Zn-dependent protease
MKSACQLLFVALSLGLLPAPIVSAEPVIFPTRTAQTSEITGTLKKNWQLPDSFSSEKSLPFVPEKSVTQTPTPADQPILITNPKKFEELPQQSPVTSEQTTEEQTAAEKQRRLEVLAQADQLYLAGDYAGAEKLYRSVKPPFPEELQATERKEAITDPEQLPPAGKVYWREALIGFEQNLETKMMVPLKFLVEQYPEFIPGYLLYAEVLTKHEKPKEALDLLERATNLYPDQPDLLKARVQSLAANEKWLEASVAARQFAILNPDHPDAPELTELAETNDKRFRSELREKITGNAIANGILGIVTFAVTGSPIGTFSALQTAAILLEGESALGARIADSARDHLELVRDPQVVGYINDLGQKIARLSGRDFEYEFYVIRDKDLNAFALPGGKVFINAGVILQTDSEAELAGLITHELSHAILSHGFQQVTKGNLLANIAQFIPLGGPLTDLLMLDYSRDQERQADILGTRLLVAAGYASDGLYNLMVTLQEEKGGGSSFISFFSTHPATKDRIKYLVSLIQQNGYNRYAYEGVDRHSQIKARLEKLLKGEKKDPLTERVYFE